MHHHVVHACQGREIKMPAKKTTEKSSSQKTGELYTALGVDKTATGEEIKKAYYKLALKLHPDRCPAHNAEESKMAFQVIGRAYEVLSDTDRRRLYDETGIVEGETQVTDWGQYFRDLFKRVSFEELDSFKTTYVGSAEEYEDVLAAYVKHDGDLARVAETVFFGDVESEARYLQFIKGAIAKGIVAPLKGIKELLKDESKLTQQQKKRRRQAAKEAQEAAELAREMGLDGSEDGLIAAIKNKQKARMDSLVSDLEVKYAKKAKSKK